jgi:hypothetical protein
VDNLLVAVWAEFFLFPWGFVLITVAAASAFSFAVAAAAATATLGECRNECRYLLALFYEFGLEKCDGIDNLWYGCAFGGSVRSEMFPSRRE